jgi:hypothetical protein
MIYRLLLSLVVVLGTAGYVVSERLKPNVDPIGLVEPGDPKDANAPVLPADDGDGALDALNEDAGAPMPLGTSSLDPLEPGTVAPAPTKREPQSPTTGSLQP